MRIGLLKRSYFWFYYLGVVWALLFFFPVHLLMAPLCLLGFYWPPAWGAATYLNRLMFRIILALQPWYRAEIDIRLPPAVANRTAGCLVVSNHRSHLDAFLLFRELTHLRLVAKHALYYVPLYGHMMVLLRMIRVRQKDPSSYLRAMAKVSEGLRAGHRVHVFPEMTRCEPGTLGTNPFQRAPFHAAREAGAPILPIAIWGTDEVWGKGSQRISLGKKMWAKSLAPVDPCLFPDSLTLANHVRAEIEKAVRELRTSAEARP
jgi:1-acyl-sn-glycerol-3-phosphate acyltransferase